MDFLDFGEILGGCIILSDDYWLSEKNLKNRGGENALWKLPYLKIKT